MCAAEALIAMRGIGGVSAREIAKAANLRNNCSVQYHFGSMEGLLDEIVLFRMRQLDEVRAEMIEAKDFPRENPGLLDLMKVICLAHLEIRAADNRHNYAAFLCQYLPIYHPTGFKWLMRSSVPQLPAIGWAIKEIRHALHRQLSPDMLDRRLTSASLLFLNVMQGFSREVQSGSPISADHDVIRDALRQSVAVLRASIIDSETF